MRQWIFLLFFVPVLNLSAQWSSDPTVNNPLCTAVFDQTNPRMAADGSGGAIVVWEDNRNTGTVSDIFAQRINASGNVLWAHNGIPVCSAIGVQQRPELIADGSGGMIVVWEDARNGDFDIYAQRIDSTGAAIWSSNGVAICNAAWAQRYPVLCANQEGGAIITWQDSRHLGYEVYAQHIADSGRVRWQTGGIPICNSELTHILPRIVGDGRNGAIIIWEDGRNSASGGDLYAQRVHADGSIRWTGNGISVTTAVNSQRSPDIISDGLSGAIVCWYDMRNGNGNADVYAQRIDSSGARRWGSGGNAVPVCTAPRRQGPPRLVSDGANGAIIAWRDFRDSTLIRIYSRRVTQSGNPAWNNNGNPVCTVPRAEQDPGIVADGSGGAIIVWTDSRFSTTDTEIRAQRITPNGGLLWMLQGSPICTATGAQAFPHVIQAGNASSIVVWADKRNTQTLSDIYISHLGAGGAIPVELSFFRVSVSGGRCTLTWSTAGEFSNFGFAIEQKLSGNIWNRIGFVPGKGTTTYRSDYEFVDPVPVYGMGFTSATYRLRQIDFDGKETLSPEVHIEISQPADVPEISLLYPDPFESVLRVEYTLPFDDAVSLRLTDLSGKTVTEPVSRQFHTAGLYSLAFVPSGLATGTYLVVLHTSTTSVRRTIRYVR